MPRKGRQNRWHSYQAYSGCSLVLMDPFVLASGRLANGGAFRKWRDQVERLIPVVKKLAAEYDAVHVRLQEVFDAAAQTITAEHWIWDGVHPLPQGHELIARAWLEGVSSRWPHSDHRN